MLRRALGYTLEHTRRFLGIRRGPKPAPEKRGYWVRQSLYTLTYLVLELLTALLAPAVYLAWVFEWLDAQAQRHVLKRDVEIPKARDGVHFTLGW
jgi:hypothetical protein